MAAAAPAGASLATAPPGSRSGLIPATLNRVPASERRDCLIARFRRRKLLQEGQRVTARQLWPGEGWVYAKPDGRPRWRFLTELPATAADLTERLMTAENGVQIRHDSAMPRVATSSRSRVVISVRVMGFGLVARIRATRWLVENRASWLRNITTKVTVLRADAGLCNS